MRLRFVCECVYVLKKNTHVYVCVGCEIDAFAIEIVAFARADDRGRLEFLLSTDPPPSLPESAQYWKHGWELSDRFNIKFGPLDSNAGVFGGAGGGEKDRWAAAKWDHKKDTQVWNI